MSILKSGDRINNYLLEKQVGAGSFGEVWRARHHVFGDIVAIKIPTDTQYVRNLQREGVAIHGLKHPNVVRAIDLDPYGDPPYLIMEFVEGPSLREAIDQYGRKFPVDAAIAIARGVLHALSVSHQHGLIHRDVKPAIILLAHPIENLASIESGIPTLINTSFNMHEEPIVCTPGDAIRAFLQGNLDVLAIGPYLVPHPKAHEGEPEYSAAAAVSG